MRIALALVILLIACLMAANCSAQSTSRFQSVSGEFGKTWITNFQAEKPKTAQENKSGNLWSWGSAPRGNKIVNGKLVPDIIYNTTLASITNDWMGDAYVDPYSGNPITAYIDPETGLPVYVYIDPNTGQPVRANIDPATGNPFYTSPSSTYTGIVGSNNAGLPPVFSSDKIKPYG